MSELDMVLGYYPLATILLAAVIGAILGGALGAALGSRRRHLLEVAVADQAETIRVSAEAERDLLHRLSGDDSGPITAIADAVTDYDIGAGGARPHPGGDWTPLIYRDHRTERGQHRAR